MQYSPAVPLSAQPTDSNSLHVAADRLAKNKDRILRLWEEEARKQVPAAAHQAPLALIDSLPDLIDELIKTLAQPEPTLALKSEETRLAREHGEERAALREYSLDQVIWEYQILHNIMFHILEEDGTLSSFARDIVGRAIFLAIRNAASEFTNHREARQHADYADLIDNVFDYAIFFIDESGNIQSWNAGAQRMKGYKSEEIIGHHLRELYLPEDRVKKRPEHNLKEARVRGHVEDEGLRLRKDKTTFWASVNITRILGPDGKLRGFAKVIRDLTSRKQMEDDLRHALRVRDEFLSMCSHELKTPLTSIQLQIDMAFKSLESSQPLNPNRLRIVKKQISRLSHLIEDMMEVSQNAGGEIPLTVSVFDFGEPLTEIKNHFCLDEPVGSCEIELDCTPGTLIEADRDRVSQVVTNLLSNAVKYGQGKPIEIKLLAENSFARLMVKDKGIGIGKENHLRIFEQYERVSSPNNIAGLGMGLYLAKRIINAHQGRIWVESEIEKGATFIMEIPLKIKGHPQST